MRLKVNEGWEPGITWDGKLYAPGDTFEIDDDAGQFLANGSAVEARTNPKRRAPMFCARPLARRGGLRAICVAIGRGAVSGQGAEVDAMAEAAHETRLARVLGVPLAEDAVRQWPQSGEAIRGRERIAEVESHFVGLRLGVGRRHVCGDTVVVEWSTDYGDGRVYRNVTVAELRDGQAVKVTDYWGEPFSPPPWREVLADPLDMPSDGTWPPVSDLVGD